MNDQLIEKVKEAISIEVGAYSQISEPFVEAAAKAAIQATGVMSVREAALEKVAYKQGQEDLLNEMMEEAQTHKDRRFKDWIYETAHDKSITLKHNT